MSPCLIYFQCLHIPISATKRNERQARTVCVAGVVEKVASALIGPSQKRVPRSRMHDTPTPTKRPSHTSLPLPPPPPLDHSTPSPSLVSRSACLLRPRPDLPPPRAADLEDEKGYVDAAWRGRQLNMLLPKGGVNWKAAKARLPPSRAIWNFLTRTRFLLFVVLVGVVILIWNGLRGTAGEMQR